LGSPPFSSGGVTTATTTDDRGPAGGRWAKGRDKAPLGGRGVALAATASDAG